MQRLLVVLGILVLGCVSGSWVSIYDFRIMNDEYSNQSSVSSLQSAIGSLQLAVDNMQSIIGMEQDRGEAEKKVIDCIEQYNSGMADSLKGEIARVIIEMTLRYDNLGINTILAVISWESALTWDPRIVSPVGAIGLMQIMPRTGGMLARQEGLSDFALIDLYNPIINIRLGCRYLSHLVRLYGSLEIALAAYNGGPRNARLFAERDKENCHPETWGYVPAVMGILDTGY